MSQAVKKVVSHKTSAVVAALTCCACGKPVDQTLEYILAHCARCGCTPFHPQCIIDLQRFVEKNNSKARENKMVWARHHPERVLLRMKCPVNCYKGDRAPNRCSGRIVHSELVKPLKPAPAPPPFPAQPPPRHHPPCPKLQTQAQPPGGWARPAKKPPHGGKPSPSQVAHLQHKIDTLQGTSEDATHRFGVGGSHLQVGATAKKSGTFKKASMKDSFSSPDVAVGSQPHPPSTLHFVAARRPRELRMCINWREYGDCHIYQCSFCHGEKELAMREKRWLAELAKKQAKERLNELAAHKQRQATERQALALPPDDRGRGGTSQAAWQQGVARSAAVPRPPAGVTTGLSDVEVAFVKLSEATFNLMKEHKRRNCMYTLLAMGFPQEDCRRAADATGCNAMEAVQLLVEGGTAFNASLKPVDVTGEAQALLALALALGKSLEDVELELVIRHGNWEAAGEALEAGDDRCPPLQDQFLSVPPSPHPASLASTRPPSNWSTAPPTPIPLSPAASLASKGGEAQPSLAASNPEGLPQIHMEPDPSSIQAGWESDSTTSQWTAFVPAPSSPSWQEPAGFHDSWNCGIESVMNPWKQAPPSGAQASCPDPTHPNTTSSATHVGPPCPLVDHAAHAPLRMATATHQSDIALVEGFPSTSPAQHAQHADVDAPQPLKPILTQHTAPPRTEAEPTFKVPNADITGALLGMGVESHLALSSCRGRSKLWVDPSWSLDSCFGIPDVPASSMPRARASMHSSASVPLNTGLGYDLGWEKLLGEERSLESSLVRVSQWGEVTSGVVSGKELHGITTERAVPEHHPNGQSCLDGTPSLQSGSVGNWGLVEDEGELQDMLSLLCT